MKRTILLISCLTTLKLFAQNDTTNAKSDTTVVDVSKEVGDKKNWANNIRQRKFFTASVL